MVIKFCLWLYVLDLLAPNRGGLDVFKDVNYIYVALRGEKLQSSEVWFRPGFESRPRVEPVSIEILAPLIAWNKILDRTKL